MSNDIEATTLVRRFYEQAWNLWDDAVVDDILSTDFSFRGSLGDEVRGRDGWRAYRDKIRHAVPDFHNEIVELVTSPGRAAARLRYTGQQTGVLLGHQGHGQRIEYAGAAFFTCDNGQLGTAWVLGDLDSLRRQVAGT
ncbi:MAG: ester cyclase [Micromonosporaceae bacterium]